MSSPLNSTNSLGYLWKRLFFESYFVSPPWNGHIINQGPFPRIPGFCFLKWSDIFSLIKQWYSEHYKVLMQYGGINCWARTCDSLEPELLKRGTYRMGISICTVWQVDRWSEIGTDANVAFVWLSIVSVVLDKWGHPFEIARANCFSLKGS